MRRGSITISLAPCFSTAAFICRAMMGWFSVVLEPVTMKTVGLDHLGGGVAHGGGAHRLLQRHHRPGMAQAGAVIDVVGAEQGAEHLLQQVVVFVGGFGAAVHRQRLRAIPPVDLHQPVGHVIQRLVPAHLAPLGSGRRPGCARPASGASCGSGAWSRGSGGRCKS